jgi:hypothetical protein
MNESSQSDPVPPDSLKCDVSNGKSRIAFVFVCFPSLVAIPLLLSTLKGPINATPLLVCEFVFCITLCLVGMNLLGLYTKAEFLKKTEVTGPAKKKTYWFSWLAGMLAYISFIGFIYQYSFLSPVTVFVYRTVRLLFNVILARILHNSKLCRTQATTFVLLFLLALIFQTTRNSLNDLQNKHTTHMNMLGFGSAMLSNLCFAVSYSLDAIILHKTPCDSVVYPNMHKDVVSLCVATISWLLVWGLSNQFNQYPTMVIKPMFVICTSGVTALAINLSRLLTLWTSPITLDCVNIVAIVIMYGIAILTSIEPYNLSMICSVFGICIVMGEYNMTRKQNQ